MHWGGPAFVITLVALSMGAWVITTWIRAKHGYPVEDWTGFAKPVGRGDADSDRKIAVLERIATDPAERTAREIDALR